MMINDFKIEVSDFIYCDIKNLVYFETKNSLTIRFNDKIRLKLVKYESANNVTMSIINKDCGEIDQEKIYLNDYPFVNDFIEKVNEYIRLWI